MSRDIIFKTEEYVFSYRVAGLLIQNGKVLLQKPVDDTGYAIPGGHVALGETNEETLIREFKEEINADIKVDKLRWVGELFFPWGDKPCHQICLFYEVSLAGDINIPLDGTFFGTEQLEGKSFKLEFSWVDTKAIKNIELYPIEAKEYLYEGLDEIKHFVYKQD
ncbi:NUDIX hydrolase [Clostridium sp. YIM B02505]|uniref:NUDIX hydrolase n=1 Tax=Clostridium yunnanense TaxID=2800325 RepID=A0ABS1EV00_9CLOT|nr:NUDIX hydrolase [Clostridium yunnanense]MBK1813211.1 NUDIX hydrolase [Clostridium yunnanense]